MKVLVTGGAGYIGSHACKALLRAGHLPITYDNLSNGHLWAVKWGPVVIGDLLDREALDRAFKHYKPEAIMHFAGLAYVGESMKRPGDYFRNNFVGSLNLLESARANDVGKIVFSSTCATYGVPSVTPISENHPQHPINPYGASKLMVERALHDFYFAHGLQSVSLRYFNAAGADLDGDIGEAHHPETHLIPLLLDVAAGKSSYASIFGRDYETLDGTCVRDYIHVSDLADAHVLALDALCRDVGCKAYNLGNGNGYSVLEVIRIVERVTGKPIKVIDGPRRLGDPAHLVGDPTMAARDLSWRPMFSDLTTIIESAWRWHRVKAR